jgi:CubicO group peptidase (beta-lactamase class C family)
MRPPRLIVRLSLALTVFTVACATEDGAPPSATSTISEATPADVGFSTEGIAAITPAMQELIDDGRTGGVMTLVARDGKIVHWDAVGWRVVDEDPLERDDIFRIYSMTKPITSTAAMILVEEGAIALDQPLSDFIPAFGDVKVYDDGELRVPARPIAIRDLMRHTSGLTYGIFGNHPVDIMYREEFNALGRNTGMNLQATANAIAEMPLLADPGTLWNYSVSTDVLGRVVEIASGASLADFFRTRIFEPLGMDDSAFHVSAENLDRLTAVYGGQGEALEMTESPVDGAFTRAPSWYSGGGGLTSSAMDYLRFTQMLLNEGELDGVRLLKTETVRDMRRNQLPVEMGTMAPGGSEGFGLGFAVVVEGDRKDVFYWSGVANTWFWIDPVENIIAFAWTQSAYADPPLNPMMRGLVYDALEESNRMVEAGSGAGAG